VTILATIVGLLGWWVPLAHATFPYSMTFKNPANSTHNLKDVTVETIGIAKIDGINANGAFATSGRSKDGKAAKFDGGAIAPGTSTTVQLNLSHKVTGPIHPVVIDETSWASTPFAFGVSESIFSGAIAGGPLGDGFAGIPIPADEYLYMYQLKGSEALSMPFKFEIELLGGAPTSIGVLFDTWTPASLLPVPGPLIVDGDGFAIGQEWGVFPAMLPEYLTGMGGALPTSWGSDGGKMVADFAAPLGAGDVSSVLWFTHVRPPAFGGPDLAGHNAALLDDTGMLFSAAAEAPVPEPATLVLAAIGAAIIVTFARRRQNPPR
jgi:hypothetical protein